MHANGEQKEGIMAHRSLVAFSVIRRHPGCQGIRMLQRSRSRHAIHPTSGAGVQRPAAPRGRRVSQLARAMAQQAATPVLVHSRVAECRVRRSVLSREARHERR